MRLMKRIGDPVRVWLQQKLLKPAASNVESYRVRTLTEESAMVQQQIAEQRQQQYQQLLAELRGELEATKWRLHELEASQSAPSGAKGVRKAATPRKSRRVSRHRAYRKRH